jgi:hypothetical protein
MLVCERRQAVAVLTVTNEISPKVTDDHDDPAGVLLVIIVRTRGRASA